MTEISVFRISTIRRGRHEKVKLTMHSFGWFSEPPRLPDLPDLEIAQHGSPYEKSSLAERENLSREAFAILADTTNIDIITSLAMNYTTPAEILDRIAKSHPELHAFTATNPSASPELMKTAPLSEHISSSIEEFLNHMDATDDEARALVKRLHKLRPPGGPLLGEVWAQIRGES